MSKHCCRKQLHVFFNLNRNLRNNAAHNPDNLFCIIYHPYLPFVWPLIKPIKVTLIMIFMQQSQPSFKYRLFIYLKEPSGVLLYLLPLQGQPQW